MIVAVTGHRPDKLGGEYDMKGPISKKIYQELDRLVTDLKPTLMISGMALGVDMLFANVAINRKIPFDAYAPFRGQEARWPEQSQKLYSKMLGYARAVVYVCNEGYEVWKMQKRNEAMVDSSDVLIAVWDGSKGGTFNCVNYAINQEVEIKRINPLEL